MPFVKHNTKSLGALAIKSQSSSEIESVRLLLFELTTSPAYKAAICPRRFGYTQRTIRLPPRNFLRSRPAEL
ncbi:hypothetical protein ALTERO38_51214 [Alteromonas sp. 38]|nr:hypothetical protein ALTER154_70396 [Alteromonas sp. 154]VXB65021.1 hypothetical protein ALTERO38_51214 [Alteromonas sp. 38]